MVGFLVHNTRGPPLGLGLFGVASSARSGACWSLATVVRVFDLFAGLDELDEGLGNYAAVELLEVLEGTLVVRKDFGGVTDTQRHHVVGAIGGTVIAVRPGICEAIFRDWCITAAAANTARGSVGAACKFVVLVWL